MVGNEASLSAGVLKSSLGREPQYSGAEGQKQRRQALTELRELVPAASAHLLVDAMLDAGGARRSVFTA